MVLDPSGAPFDLMSRRVLATNSHLGSQVAGMLKQAPEGALEPKPTSKGA